MLMPSIFKENLIDDFFDDFSRPTRSVAKYNTPTTNIMRTDIKENENGYELSIEMPGYKKEDLNAELEDGYLTISAKVEKENEQKDEKEHFLHRERYVGSCNRTFYVGDAIKQEDIKAKFENGILKVTVPKKKEEPEKKENKYIAIED